MNPTLAKVLSQITTESANLPGTLGIKGILQGGSGGLYLLASFDNGTYDGSATNTVEWIVTGMDTDFIHHVPADPSGNTLGPFVVDSIVKLRTRVTNANGTTTGSIRTLVVTTARPVHPCRWRWGLSREMVSLRVGCRFFPVRLRRLRVVWLAGRRISGR